MGGLPPIPGHIKQGIWDYVRPYKDHRFYLRDLLNYIPGVPSWVKMFVKGSVDLEALITFAIGADPGPRT